MRQRKLVTYGVRYNCCDLNIGVIDYTYEFEKMEPCEGHRGGIRFVKYDPDYDHVTHIEEHCNGLTAALRSLDKHHNLFLKLKEEQ